MAGKTIKGLTVEIGGDTTKLGKALESVNSKSKSLSSELGQINRLLKLDPGNTELLAQKQKVLADAISNTESKLNTLREAEKQVQAQFEKGEVSEEQYRQLQREIIATEKKLDGYKNAAKETADAVENLGKASEDAAEDISKAEKAAEEADEAAAEMRDTLASAAKTGFTALVAAATAAVGALVATAEATREYRTAIGKLDTAFKDSGHSGEVATETYKELQSILGDTDQAVEAANHLAKLCDTEEDLAAWTEIATGAYAVFGDSLPIEGLTEAANETAKAGQVTGPLADALNWAAEEGMDFGVTLKENIDFTKKSSKELKKMTDKQREEYEARKKQHEEIEAYNKRVEEAVSAEDKFNIALENCTDEQERQQLITKTLTKMYSSAAAQYKKTNAEVIRANEATEKWNAAMAEVGGYMEPVVTDIKEMGVALLENAQAPLKKVADFIRNTLLPSLLDFSGWVKTHIPQIGAGMAGLAAALAAYEVATIATTVAHNGLKGAIMATTVAQKALALVQAATPWGLIATAVAGVATALVVLSATTKDSTEPVNVLTEEEKKLAAAADEAAQSFRDQQATTQETMGGITAQMDYVSDLSTELQELAGSSGRVLEKDKERAQFILNELNNALGTEYSMTGNVIDQYHQLKTNIDQVIQAKLANSLLEAANADYVAAIQNEAGALENLNIKEQEYRAQLDFNTQKEQEYTTEREALLSRLESARWNNNVFEEAMLTAQIGRLDADMQECQENLAEKKEAYDQAAVDYGNYHNTIANYEEAQGAILAGNTDKAVSLLKKKGGSYGDYADTVDDETKKVLDTLYKEAIDAGIEAERMKKNFENGVDGYTKEMVDEADKGYQDALDEFANAYADAESVGGDLSDGLSGGMESRRSSLYSKAKSLVSGIISAMRKEADSHSPARKTIDFGEDMGEGAEIGIDNKTNDVKKAATRQTAAILDAYNSQEVAGQNALRNVAERNASRQVANQIAAIGSNGPMLERILAAIEKGHILVLDGDAVVGGTVGKTDAALGLRRILVERGAL